MRRAVALFVLIPLVATAQQAPRAEVPVSSVVLFSSGVGYFEHSGTVRGGAATELRFRATQMNDVIKSLVLQDMDGGKVTSVTYPSQDPLSKTLKSFQVDITANPSVAQLLNQLRGSKVIVQAQAERIVGTILGVETRSRPGPTPDTFVELPILNVVAGGTIRSIDLQSVTSLTLDDAQLQEELTKALTSLTQSRDQDKKPVIINFSGSGDRRVKVAYVVEAPVWKTSYRLLLGDKQTHIQGWGIVENQTESDWNNVSLSLVSGRPISFQMDLYTPIYLQRPLVQPEEYAQLQPQIYARGVSAVADSAIGGRAASAPRRIGYDAQGRPQSMQLSELVVTAAHTLNATASVESQATTQQLGELFEFTVKNVTLPRQKSAMIPIVTDPIEAERVSIYNAATLATNPLNGLRLRNTTGKTLLQGPVTIIDHEMYAGDARIGDLPAGQERLLSYGIDLETAVITRDVSNERVTIMKIVKGILGIDRRMQTAREYVAENKSSRNRILIIEHPVRDNWKLVDSPVPYESTNGVHRFRVELPAGKKVTTTIRQEWTYSQSMTLGTMAPGELLSYSRTGEISRSVRAAIERVAELRQKAIDLSAQIEVNAQKLAQISTEQSRIRENMKTVGQTSQYYERLLAKLNEQESQIEQLQKEKEELTVRRNAAQREVSEYLANLTLD
jgi:hypothetical protein